ncbi:XRE family transcriptional regulator [Tamaricihabitans halophyticus]|uniref:XRE family transcriptional regulator n=1 Tax=Tamaricihabitans halophyticus TaxID=1262583 RepID=A0A4R2QDJ7_9PSEU|nr:helix-turn-helix domain-containing protein [Tamaricihabitans halophyticus]TCP45071.1 XRE family transcriptional regulator [Tamaricihabitans halophyticus]
MDEQERPLAGNLRRQRQRAGLSVVELARRAGLGRATLTQLEAGTGNPTLETLYALASELGVTLADLIAEPAHTAGPRVIRAGAGEATRGAVVEARLLHRAGHSTGTVELYAVTLWPEECQLSRPHAPGTREHLHVHSGRAVVGPADAPIELGADDYVDFPADVPHSYRAIPGEQPVRATLTIHTPTS